jgi:hypothetical protein
MDTPILLDAVGVQLAPGQRVLYCPAFRNGALQHGTIIRVGRRPHPFGPPRDHVAIRRDDGKTIVIGWGRRIAVLQQPTEADAWLRRELATLGKRS